MPRDEILKAIACCTLLALPAGWGCAQQTIGSVAAADAQVTASGGRTVAVRDGRAVLTGASTVKAAAEHNAEIALARGGNILVCQTSVVHVSEAAGPAAKPATLLLALDRGALEIKHKAEAGDQLLTPDMRLTTASEGPLDLRVRVVFEGDTCVENRGRRAPVLELTNAFGDASYELKAGQHVTFVKGDLRQVVDHETTPCGCPPAAGEVQKGQKMSLADAVIQGRPSGKGADEHQGAAAANPFPVAASEGLAPAATPVPEKPGETHVEISSQLTYDPNAAPRPAAPVDSAPSAGAAPAAAGAQAAAQAPAPAAIKPAGGPLGAIGRFFKRLFVR